MRRGQKGRVRSEKGKLRGNILQLTANVWSGRRTGSYFIRVVPFTRGCPEKGGKLRLIVSSHFVTKVIAS